MKGLSLVLCECRVIFVIMYSYKSWWHFYFWDHGMPIIYRPILHKTVSKVQFLSLFLAKTGIRIKTCLFCRCCEGLFMELCLLDCCTSGRQQTHNQGLRGQENPISLFFPTIILLSIAFLLIFMCNNIWNKTTPKPSNSKDYRPD